jgi:hypothetical protein
MLSGPCEAVRPAKIGWVAGKKGALDPPGGGCRAEVARDCGLCPPAEPRGLYEAGLVVYGDDVVGGCGGRKAVENGAGGVTSVDPWGTAGFGGVGWSAWVGGIARNRFSLSLMSSTAGSCCGGAGFGAVSVCFLLDRASRIRS